MLLRCWAAHEFTALCMLMGCERGLGNTSQDCEASCRACCCRRPLAPSPHHLPPPLPHAPVHRHLRPNIALPSPNPPRYPPRTLLVSLLGHARLLHVARVDGHHLDVLVAQRLCAVWWWWWGGVGGLVVRGGGGCSGCSMECGGKIPAGVRVCVPHWQVQGQQRGKRRGSVRAAKAGAALSSSSSLLRCAKVAEVAMTSDMHRPHQQALTLSSADLPRGICALAHQTHACS